MTQTLISNRLVTRLNSQMLNSAHTAPNHFTNSYDLSILSAKCHVLQRLSLSFELTTSPMFPYTFLCLICQQKSPVITLLSHFFFISFKLKRKKRVTLATLTERPWLSSMVARTLWSLICNELNFIVVEPQKISQRLNSSELCWKL